MPKTKEQIIEAYNNLRDCCVEEFEVDLLIEKYQLDKKAKHKLVQLARQALSDL